VFCGKVVLCGAPQTRGSTENKQPAFFAARRMIALRKRYISIQPPPKKNKQTIFKPICTPIANTSYSCPFRWAWSASRILPRRLLGALSGYDRCLKPGMGYGNIPGSCAPHTTRPHSPHRHALTHADTGLTGSSPPCNTSGCSTSASRGLFAAHPTYMKYKFIYKEKGKIKKSKQA